ncbi:hypothetical protein crov140 [Cafeteria roenbergensis virus]|uniref:YprB ribonuclease H-like domain-containing protein n=1 Tax=Cafeteria roenbergensis virus (strain BV-PW1) TaxID=693272 RepID=E3T4R0_CROVB|nr:hypothetical protein crov140 [Cafeteria roenbergensis virus BV-PW1]ADO67173.1 hypothetical protein crov140 [Cafeteria roenbergensis virus BV-PW1]
MFPHKHHKYHTENSEFIENLFLKYIFPKYKFYQKNDSLYVESKFLDNFTSGHLSNFGYKKIYNIINPNINLYTRKRLLNNTIFNKQDFTSPSRIKLYVDEPFKSMIKEIEPYKITPSKMEMAFGVKGNIFENYCLKKIEEKLLKINKKYKIIKICKTIPDINDYELIKYSYDVIKSGAPIIYQPLLIDSTDKIYGCPDLLIRSDILLELFPKNNLDNHSLLSIKNNFGNYFYMVVDIKILSSKILSNGLICQEKKMELNKLQIYIYNRMLSKIQGKLPLDYNFGYIISPKIIYKAKAYSGLEYIGKFEYDTKYETQLQKALSGIREFRNINNIKKLLKNPENKPKRKKNNYFGITKDSFTNIKKELGYTTIPKFKVNPSNFKKVQNTLKNLNLVYVDFEAINLILNLSPEEYQHRIQDGNNQVCQIGVVYITNNQINYKSFFAEDYTQHEILKIYQKLIFLLKQLEKTSNKKLGVISWGNFERTCYNEMKKKYNLPEINIIDLCNEIKKAGIFPVELSLSLKTLLPLLHKKYPHIFTMTYDNLNISDGEIASVELFNYYKTNIDTKNKIKEEIEKYNYMDCIVLKQIVDWININ